MVFACPCTPEPGLAASHALRRRMNAIAIFRRMSALAHLERRSGLMDMELADVVTDEEPVIYPHETCPADGLVDRGHAALPRFRGSRSFVRHLGPSHQFQSVIISGDNGSEVRYLAEQVGISEIHTQKSPEEKLALVHRETAAARTSYVGDGINDAPAMMVATMGMVIGCKQRRHHPSGGIGAWTNSLRKVDEFMHISRRIHAIALQSAVGSMALSLIGMAFAAAGYLAPVMGAITQEVIDVLAVLNALRTAFQPQVIHDV